MGGLCYRKGYEQGAWYEIRCFADNIRSKESRGGDASFERECLKSWANYEGYEGAREALADLSDTRKGRV